MKPLFLTILGLLNSFTHWRIQAQGLSSTHTETFTFLTSTAAC
jgi:hypothetical protein